MGLSDALAITVLGMGMVFLGLILTSLLILAFGWLGRVRRGAHGRAGQAVVTGAVSASLPRPEVLVVIATVLEVERRLYHAAHGRLTITPHGTTPQASGGN